MTRLQSLVITQLLVLPGVATASLVGLNLEQHAVDGNGIATLNGTTTWRLYAEFDDPSDQLTSVGGANPTVGAIISSGGFYQNAIGGQMSSQINQGFVPFEPEIEYDSWVTIGAEWASESATLTSTGINWSDFNSGNDLFIAAGEWNRPVGDLHAFGQIMPGMANYQILVGQFTTFGSGPTSAPWGQLNLSGYSSAFGLNGELGPWSVDNVSFGTPVPAPSAIALLGISALAGGRRRRR